VARFQGLDRSGVKNLLIELQSDYHNVKVEWIDKPARVDAWCVGLAWASKPDTK